MLKKISVGAGSAALMLTILLYGMHYGFWQGYEGAYKNYHSGYHFIVHGPHLYEIFAAKYSYITGLLFLFLGAQLIRQKLLLFVVSFSSLGLAIYVFWQIHLMKSERLVELTESTEATQVLDPLYSMIKETYQLDWLCFLLIAALIGLQIAILVKSFMKAKVIA